MTVVPHPPFVPLAPGPVQKAGREDFHVLVSEHPESARPLPTLEPTSFNHSSAHAPLPACEPQVTLHREGDCISLIRIQCSCGQLIDLACAYQPAKA